jgi:phospholipase C
MSRTSWLTSLQQRLNRVFRKSHSRKSKRRPPAARLLLETLEDRVVLAGNVAAPSPANLAFNNVTASPVTTTAFVNDLYLDVMFRAPTAAELSSMTSSLTSGQLSSGGAFASLTNSAEYKNIIAPILTYYEAYLGRHADYGGINGWTNGERQGMTPGQIAGAIVQSPESMQTNGSNPLSLSNSAFLTYLYQFLFNRAPDTPGLNGWMQALTSGQLQKSDLLSDFLMSPEWTAKQVSNATLVTSAYLGLWNMSPDANASTYVNGLANGTIKDATALGTQLIAGTPYLGVGATRNYVIALYEGLLGRDPSQDLLGYRTWRTLMIGQKVSDADALAFFVSSPEFQAKNLSPTGTATAIYKTLLGRAPTTAELATALPLVSSGRFADVSALAEQILTSNEFTQNSYAQNVQHTIVLYEENWSFDGLYGNFPGANGFANLNLNTLGQTDAATGLPITSTPAPTNEGSANFPDQGVITATPDPRFPPTNGQAALPVLPYNLGNFVQPNQNTGDIVHRFYHEQLQIDNGVLQPSTGQNDGYMTWSDNPGLVMSFFNTTGLPEFQLAQQYTLDDNFFHSAYGGSYLNHQYLIAAAASQWMQPLPASNPNFVSVFNPTVSITNEIDTNANAGGATTLTYAFAHTPVYPDTVSGSVFIGASATASYTFSINIQNVVTLTPVGTPAVTISSASFTPTTGVLTLNWASNPGATSVKVSYKYGNLNDGNLSNPTLTTQSPQGATLNPSSNTMYLINTSYGSQMPIPTKTVSNETDTNPNAGGATALTYTFAHVSVYPGTVSGSIFIGASTTAAYTFTVNAAGVVTLTPNGTPAITISSATFNATTGALTLNWASNPGATSVTVSYHYGSVSRDQLLLPINDTNPSGAGYETNIGDELNTKNISWKWYSGGWNNAVAGTPDVLFQFHHQPLAYFANYTPFNADGTLNTTNLSQKDLQDEQNYLNDVAADNSSLTTGNLPAVSFIKPIGENNDHPGYTDIADGQNHEMELISTIQNSIDWSNSNIVITYDENGGRWDQVNPPMIDQWGVGTRVPGIEVSPFARRGFVDHQQLETDSILTTIEQQYGLSAMGTHDAKANGLYSAYDFSPTDVLKNNRPSLPALPAIKALSNGFKAGDVVVSQVGNGITPLKTSDLNHDLTAPVFLDDISLSGKLAGQLALPATASGANHGIVTSGGSKSEGGLNLSSDGHYLTYIGYDTTNLINPVGTSDVSKTLAGGGPTVAVNRDIARINAAGAINTTTSLTDAYQGDNARAAVSIDGAEFFSVGNADKTVINTLGPRFSTLGASTSTLLGTVTGTPSKSDNFRAVQIFNGNVYVAKGSGGTGSNGIFLVGPTSSTSGGETTTPLPGLSLVVGNDGPNVIHPFGFFFANATTLYVADEGFLPGPVNPSDPTTFAPSPLAGIQKWVLQNGTWVNVYTLTAGLGLGKKTLISGVTSWTEGLRNMTAQLNADGTITLLAVTAQNDTNVNTGDGDPNALVKITDTVAATTLPATESFSVVATSPANTVFRGVAFAPT